MTYTLSAVDFAKFQELSQLIRGKITPDQSTYWPGVSADYLGNYYKAYDFLAAVQTTTEGGVSTPTADADVNVWLWLRGASQVNQGIGAFSQFIRSYSSEQYLLRTGSAPPDGFIQNASNAIANALIDDVIKHNGALPDITTLGSLDAGLTIGSLYGDTQDFAAWSGVPLFLFFGVSTFFDQNILDQKNGTYDFLALIKSGLVAAGETLAASSFSDFATAFLGALQAVTANTSGFTATKDLMVQEMGQGLDYLRTHFGDPSMDASTLLLADIQLGKLNGSDDLAVSNDASFINAGGGDDIVRADGTDGNYLDGGDGTDTLDYSEIGTPLTVRFQSSASGLVNEIVTKGGGAVDHDVDFEIIKLSDKAELR